jgi:hypothetical protein
MDFRRESQQFRNFESYLERIDSMTATRNSEITDLVSRAREFATNALANLQDFQKFVTDFKALMVMFEEKIEEKCLEIAAKRQAIEVKLSEVSQTEKENAELEERPDLIRLRRELKVIQAVKQECYAHLHEALDKGRMAYVDSKIQNESASLDEEQRSASRQNFGAQFDEALSRLFREEPRQVVDQIIVGTSDIETRLTRHSDNLEAGRDLARSTLSVGVNAGSPEELVRVFECTSNAEAIVASIKLVEAVREKLLNAIGITKGEEGNWVEDYDGLVGLVTEGRIKYTNPITKVTQSFDALKGIDFFIELGDPTSILYEEQHRLRWNLIPPCIDALPKYTMKPGYTYQLFSQIISTFKANAKVEDSAIFSEVEEFLNKKKDQFVDSTERTSWEGIRYDLHYLYKKACDKFYKKYTPLLVRIENEFTELQQIQHSLSWSIDTKELDERSLLRFHRRIEELKKCQNRIKELLESEDEKENEAILLEMIGGEQNKAAYDQCLTDMRKIAAFGGRVVSDLRYVITQHFTEARAYLKQASDSKLFASSGASIMNAQKVTEESLNDEDCIDIDVVEAANDAPFAYGIERAISSYFEAFITEYTDTDRSWGDLPLMPRSMNDRHCGIIARLVDYKKTIDLYKESIARLYRTPVTLISKSTLDRDVESYLAGIKLYEAAIARIESEYGKTGTEIMLKTLQERMSELQLKGQGLSKDEEAESKYISELIPYLRSIETTKENEDFRYFNDRCSFWPVYRADSFENGIARYAAVALYQQYSYTMNGVLIQSYGDSAIRDEIQRVFEDIKQNGLPLRFRLAVRERHLQLRKKQQEIEKGSPNLEGVVKDSDLQVYAMIQELGDNPYIYAAMMKLVHEECPVKYRTQKIKVYHALATAEAVSRMFDFNPELQRTVKGLVTERMEKIAAARKEGASEAEILAIKTASADAMMAAINEKRGITPGQKQQSKAFLSASTSKKVVLNSTYSDSGVILELYVDEDVEGVPLCIPSSLISEGEIQFGDNCEIVVQSMRVEDGNIFVSATLKRKVPLSEAQARTLNKFDIIGTSQEQTEGIDGSAQQSSRVEKVRVFSEEAVERAHREQKERDERESAVAAHQPPSAFAGEQHDVADAGAEVGADAGAEVGPEPAADLTDVEVDRLAGSPVVAGAVLPGAIHHA